MTAPIAKAINHTAAVTSATPLARAPMSGTLVVCIENDAAILDGMKTLLTAWGAIVVAVADPEAAIEAIGQIQASGQHRPACWSTIISIAATASPPSVKFAAVSARSIPAILITADRSPHVRVAARDERSPCSASR